jgi:hypothetical protein
MPSLASAQWLSAQQTSDLTQHSRRIRRVKCDELRPACKRCTSTGRACDGYPSVFRAVSLGPSSNPSPPPLSLFIYQPRPFAVHPSDVEELAHYFHRRRRVNGVSYQDEARIVLAKLSDPVVHDAFVTLRTLQACDDGQRGHLSRCHLPSAHSLHLYNAAVSSLAARLRETPGRASAHAALVCCQMFISIEIMLGDCVQALRHLILGLRIMYLYRHGGGAGLHEQDESLPDLDVFAIKLFASGYPGRRAHAGNEGAAMSVADINRSYQGRTELNACSKEALEFLSQATHRREADSDVSTDLLMRKAEILHSLVSWERTYLPTIRSIMGNMNGQLAARILFNAAFSLLLHRILELVVGLAMPATSLDAAALDRAFGPLAETASFVTQWIEARISLRTQRNVLAATQTS